MTDDDAVSQCYVCGTLHSLGTHRATAKMRPIREILRECDPFVGSTHVVSMGSRFWIYPMTRRRGDDLVSIDQTHRRHRIQWNRRCDTCQIDSSTHRGRVECLLPEEEVKRMKARKEQRWRI